MPALQVHGPSVPHIVKLSLCELSVRGHELAIHKKTETS